ncbi:extracellular solute-binding protein [Bradyrhizobium sp. ARR65]|uniref:ABC transporter substrate-binding protein n=1 Tax=Bradyrhizobium sp. ARR65 TaxID=1040989 RepID=UPI0004663EE3|nr:extracellular solute-binding protein [Bradyrhizobium sp. ARR65]
MKRRTFLKLASATAVGAVSAPYVHAQANKFAGITLRVNGFGGTYDETLKKCVAEPLKERYGLNVQFTAGPEQDDVIKLIANKSSPPFDMFLGDSPYMVQLIKSGVIEEIKASDVPNIKRVLPGFREFGDHGAPFTFASSVPVYNSKHIKEPLTSYSDIARPDLKARAVMQSPSTFGLMLPLVAIAEENGGSVANMEPAFKVMEAAKPNIVALADTTVTELQMLQNEEVYAGIFWDGRAYELRTKGVPIVTAVPPKGIYSLTTYINVVKGTKYPEAAHACVDQFLSDQGILGLSQVLRFGVTTDINLPEELRKDLLFNSPGRNALKRKVDWEAVMANRSAWIERINKIFRS